MPSGDLLAGDIVLCAPVVAAEAAQQHKDPQAHYAHLVVHGMLHLQGYDHEQRCRGRSAWKRWRREIVTRLGYPDPYARISLTPLPASADAAMDPHPNPLCSSASARS